MWGPTFLETAIFRNYRQPTRMLVFGSLPLLRGPVLRPLAKPAQSPRVDCKCRLGQLYRELARAPVRGLEVPCWLGIGRFRVDRILILQGLRA